MPLPNVNIQLQNGALGTTVVTPDKVCGLLIGDDPGSSGISAGVPQIVTSLPQAQAAGWDKIAYAWRQISEFYAEAPSGTKLYLMLMANTVTFTNACLKTNAYLKTLLDYGKGEISFWGVCRKPAGGYTETYTGGSGSSSQGVEDDVIAALANAQSLANDYAAAYAPNWGLIEGRAFDGSLANLKNLAAGSQNRVGVVLCSTEAAVNGTVHDKSAAVGLALGRLARIPVQRKISRVKDGALLITKGYIGANAIAKEVETFDVAGIAAKGYITMRTFPGVSGYYFATDPLASNPATDDYATITNRRVVDKAIRIVYQTYVNELNDDLEVDSDGKLHPGVIKSYQSKIDNAVNTAMTANGEVSRFSSFVDPAQNILSTGKVQVVCKIIPKGYSSEIEVLLGFDNPALS